VSRFPTPIIIVSRCLGFDACRYDGVVVEDDFVARLAGRARLVTVCPEVEVGMGVPREKIRLVGPGPGQRLVQPATGRDLTETMRDFAAGYLARLGPGGADGFVVKGRSPSCGIDDAKVFADWETEEVTGRGAGVFARAVIEAYPGVPVADELRLADSGKRRVFLRRVYESAWAREFPEEAPPDPPYPPELA
jgi:uncharacterized protein YbbK (DUF523 family)